MVHLDRIPLLIIGGGIGGLATALAVSQAGYSAHVIEKSAEFTEFGAGLQLAPNATRMLDRLGIFRGIKRHATFPKRLVMMDAFPGKRSPHSIWGRSSLNISNIPISSCTEAICLQRNSRLAVRTEGSRLKRIRRSCGIEDIGDGARWTCADGSAYECDALVGADGLWSKDAQAWSMMMAIPICSQFVAYRGTIPIEEAPPDSEFDAMVLWVGPDLHFVQYVVHQGTLFNQVAVFRSYHYEPDSDDWGTVEELEEHFRKMCPRVRSAVAKIKRNRRWPMLDRLPIRNWTRNHITLLGDAAHPMLQYLAQGACQALEDALLPGEVALKNPRDSCGRLPDYQEQRIPRTARVQQTRPIFR